VRVIRRPCPFKRIGPAVVPRPRPRSRPPSWAPAGSPLNRLYLSLPRLDRATRKRPRERPLGNPPADQQHSMDSSTGRCIRCHRRQRLDHRRRCRLPEPRLEHTRGHFPNPLDAPRHRKPSFWRLCSFRSPAQSSLLHPPGAIGVRVASSELGRRGNDGLALAAQEGNRKGRLSLESCFCAVLANKWHWAPFQHNEGMTMSSATRAHQTIHRGLAAGVITAMRSLPHRHTPKVTTTPRRPSAAMATAFLPRSTSPP